jgi:hypothetical protein
MDVPGTAVLVLVLFSFESFTVLTVWKLGSKLNFFLVNFELNFEFKLEFKVGSHMGQFSRASQTLPSDNKKVHSDNDRHQRPHNNDTPHQQHRQ